jgi:hypothetical protein
MPWGGADPLLERLSVAWRTSWKFDVLVAAILLVAAAGIGATLLTGWGWLVFPTIALIWGLRWLAWRAGAV